MLSPLLQYKAILSMTYSKEIRERSGRVSWAFPVLHGGRMWISPGELHGGRMWTSSGELHGGKMWISPGGLH